MAGYLFILPAAIFLFSFILYPLGRSLYLSLTDFNFIYSESPIWIGLENYISMFSEESARIALSNTAQFSSIFLPALLVLGLFIATLIDGSMLGSKLAQGLIFLPVAVPISVSGVMFLWLYNYQFGLLNWFLSLAGLGRFAAPWLSTPGTALNAMVVVKLWKDTGLAVLLFLAGLQAIPREIHDAAHIDGAGPLQSFFYVTLPNLKESLVLAGIWGLIESWKVFALPFVMTRGGPGSSTLTLYLFTYRTAFQFYNVGKASAMAFFVAFIIVFLSWLTTRLIGSGK